jgi:prepilin-type N-terminal cleavage/methylation domain-containing protein
MRCCGSAPTSRRAGFSLIELIVVMSVTLLLTGLLMPALSQVREAARRVVSASNMRQLNLGVHMFANDHNDNLPESYYLDAQRVAVFQPQELMIAHRGLNAQNWDGIGKLYMYGYCDVQEVFYCPSHKGDHPLARYRDQWGFQHVRAEPIYTNYHYCGQVDWVTGVKRQLEEGEHLTVISDGLRTRSDFNHVVGMNVARADGSVVWVSNVRDIYQSLPIDPLPAETNSEDFNSIWGRIEKKKP